MMKQALTLLLLVSILSKSYTSAEENVENQVLTANNGFTTDFYKSVTKTHIGNILFSPLSAHACLSMAYQAAAGTTKEAFTSVLKVADPSMVAEGYNSIMNNFNNAEDITLSIANKIYILSGFHWKPDFENAVTQTFQAEADSINFADSELAAATINSWVKNRTEDKIVKLFDPEDFATDTRSVLANAIYFKGNWAQQFKKQHTSPKPFYIEEHNQKDVDTMYIMEQFRYKNDGELNAKVLELPYKNKKFSMIVVLPNEKYGIADLENKLAIDYDLTKLTEGLHSDRVRVFLPKFKIQSEINLKDILTDLGLGVIFREHCDLSGMIQEEEALYVSRAIQRAYIEVNEEGAEAAAATGIVSGLRSHREGGPTFYADHPFIYMIVARYSSTPSVLFYGRLRDPTG